VGDTITDAKTARNASVPFVGVLSGVTPREAFAPYPACAILENLGDIKRII
jgi:phosphoglycolate phosphatase-like HAD superfamily hydrolase